MSLFQMAGFNILDFSSFYLKDKGWGSVKFLLEGLEQETKRRGYEFIRLNSADHRLGAHALLCKKVGYTCDKMQKRFIKLTKRIRLIGGSTRVDQRIND